MGGRGADKTRPKYERSSRTVTSSLDAPSPHETGTDTSSPPPLPCILRIPVPSTKKKTQNKKKPPFPPTRQSRCRFRHSGIAQTPLTSFFDEKWGFRAGVLMPTSSSVMAGSEAGREVLAACRLPNTSRITNEDADRRVMIWGNRMTHSDRAIEAEEKNPGEGMVG